MPKWELSSVRCTSILAHSRVDAAHIWKWRDPRTGKTEWDLAQEKAAQGWELVSVTPVEAAGNTIELLFVFKRLVEKVGE